MCSRGGVSVLRFPVGPDGSTHCGSSDPKGTLHPEILLELIMK